MSHSRASPRPRRASANAGAGARGAARSLKDDGRRAEDRHAWNQTLPNPEPIEAGIRGLVHQCRAFFIVLWLSPGRRSLALLIIGIVLVTCATAAAQVGLNAWNRPFYEAIVDRSIPAFLDQLLVFAIIAGCLLVLNVA
jgi:ABC-type uncharacterized transport system fused permease/ATPase subunit